MSRVCELTGKRAMVGNNVSHAMNKTKRKFSVNLVKKRFYIPEEDRWVTLKISTAAAGTLQHATGGKSKLTICWQSATQQQNSS